MEAWRAKKGAKAMPDGVVADADRPPKALSRSTCERLVLQLLVRLLFWRVECWMCWAHDCLVPALFGASLVVRFHHSLAVVLDRPGDYCCPIG